ncbi:MAG: hypothetical protein ABL977_08880, partial [Candidatus Eisenbacteria bacterium]
SVKDCSKNAAERPAIEEFLGAQRRFAHLVKKDPVTGKVTPKPGREADLERLRGWVQSNVERCYALAQLT